MTEISELAHKAREAFGAGWERICLTCQKPFNGDACPRCWPPKPDEIDSGIAWNLRPKDVYQWVCIRLGGTQTKDDEARWFAVRDALDKAITESDYANGRKRAAPRPSSEGETP